jgi:hypothetical protein
LTREEALRRRANRRRAMQLGIGAAGLSLGAPLALRAQGDNTRDEDEDAATAEPDESTAEETKGEATAEATEPASSHTPNDNVDLSAIGEGLFPDNRVLLYYGFPENPNMGILGEHSPEDLLERLKEQAAEYEAADPSKPFILGLELIASVAQGSPQEDDSWVADTDGHFLDQYAEFCEKNDMVLFLDVQMGFREPYEDYIGLERWMELPFVHLGIDPEFHMRGDERPGQDIGQVTAAEVTEAQHYLRDLAAARGLPRKSLIVHQFHHSMIEDKDQIAPVDGVDLIIDMDGWGPPDMKHETYTVVITNEPIEYNGVKLFYGQDDPLWTAEEVMALDPVPDLIIYQ